MQQASARRLGIILVGLLGVPIACDSASTAPATEDGGMVAAEAGAEPDSASSDGSSGDSAPPPPECKKAADCASKVCTAAGKCAAPSATDGVQNGTETDIDCGGSAAPPCDVQKKCAIAADCTQGVCKDAGLGLRCQPPSPTDGVKNGTETDVDCGGAAAPKCADAKGCGARGDCVSDVCVANLCAAAVCNDGAKNGTETAIDCGGPGCPRCADTLTCLVAGDCQSGVCSGAPLACQVPTPTDGVKNGTETDIDCGGVAAPKCVTGKTCALHADCVSDGCDYGNKCALRRSCTGHYGGDTCGAGGAGGQGAANWETCCATAPAGNGGVQMDKYKVTSGRMRAFFERVKGDVRQAVRDARAAGKVPNLPSDPAHSVLDPNWDLYLPTSMIGCDQDGTCDQHPNGAGGLDVEVTDHFNADPGSFKGIYTSAYRHVGGSVWPVQNMGLWGCRVDAPGSHTYWMDLPTQQNYFGDIATDYDQSVYDTKPLNCVPYLIAQAFCVWDGGRLETVAEWLAAIGPAAYPWGAAPTAQGWGSTNFFAKTFPGATDVGLGLAASTSIERANYYYSYEYPNLANTDYVVFFNAPGRLPKGNGPWGHSDLAYSLFGITSDVVWNANAKSATTSWANNGSWEGHGFGKGGWAGWTLFNKYGKQGLRCVHP